MTESGRARYGSADADFLARRATQMLTSFRRVSSRWPLRTSFALCFVKGVASDAVAQRVVEQKDTICVKRNLAFSVFSGAYLGCVQHHIYNITFTRLFGSSTAPLVALQKCAADYFVHVPLLYLPSYYAFQGCVLGDGAWGGIRRLYDMDTDSGSMPELQKVMRQYTWVFPLVHIINFTLTPVELRVGVVAGASFVWLVALSVLSH